ncbi:hypothetical protein ACWDR0_11810 [Streptomyces sp. NPDC003691]
MRSLVLAPVLAIGGACVLGAALLISTDSGSAAPGRTVTAPASAPGEQERKKVEPVRPDSTEARTAAQQSRQALAAAGLSVPAGWRTVQVRAERHEDRPVTVVRYERGAARTLGGEHLTTVVDGGGTLLGYTRMTPDAPGPGLPSDAAAEKAAFDWLKSFVPEHADGLSVQWVARHDEKVRDRSGAERAVSGAKVKTRHENGLYTWVIVDGRGEVVTYERDIRWDGAGNRRATAMWLHDRWIAAREGTGPRPAPPYAKP